MKLYRYERRFLVSIFYTIALILFISLDIGEGFTSRGHWVLLGITGLGFLILLFVTNAQLFRINKQYDERQKSVHLKAIGTAYSICLGWISYSVVASIFTLNPFGINSVAEFAIADVFSWCILAVSLPTAALAWFEPDPISEDIKSESTT